MIASSLIRGPGRFRMLAILGTVATCVSVGFGILVAENSVLRERLIETAREVRRSLHGHSVRAGKVVARSATEARGPLRVSPANPRYFADPSGRVVLLSGDHTWYTLQDSGVSDPPLAFDYEGFVDFLQSNGVNFFRMFVWEQAKWSEGVNGDFYYAPLPYQRTGPGVARDGKPKVDLTKFNQTYFDRLRQRVIEAGQRGIYVSVQLFEGFSVQKKPFMAANNPWPGHPFNRGNNINDIDGDPNGNGQGEETETLSIPGITALQEAYADKVIDTVNDLDNVLFEICNEAHSDSDAWQEYMIQHIHTYEAGKPKQHPVGRTVNWPNGNNAALFASSAEWISPNGDGGYYDNPPTADGSKVIVNDTDHLCYPCGDQQWMWKSFLRGLNVAFMDPYDCTADWSPGGCDPNDPVWVSLRLNLGYAVKFAERLNLAAMTPRGDLTSTGYCLANPAAAGAEYLVYLPFGGSVAVNLSATSGALSSEWFNPANGLTVSGGTVPGGGSRSFLAPFSGNAVLYIYQDGIDRRNERIPPERGRTR
jgi:uncharacterized protein DUF6298/collagenase-like protein with putative collagen-binding domain